MLWFPDTLIILVVLCRNREDSLKRAWELWAAGKASEGE